MGLEDFIASRLSAIRRTKSADKVTMTADTQKPHPRLNRHFNIKWWFNCWHGLCQRLNHCLVIIPKMGLWPTNAQQCKKCNNKRSTPRHSPRSKIWKEQESTWERDSPQWWNCTIMLIKYINVNKIFALKQREGAHKLSD